MKLEIRDQWVAALRSGDYKQGTKRLETVTPEGSEFCCLGVLCDLALKAGAPDVERATISQVQGYGDEQNSYTLGLYNGEPGVLPSAVQLWAGLDESVPNMNYEGDVNDLATMNDDFDFTFKTIADLIEEQL